VKLANALVTGASSGIGRALCIELARRGSRVVLAARRREELDAVRAEIGRAGGKADVDVVDVADADAIAARVHFWDDTLGGLDLVVANAGVDAIAKVDRFEWAKVERLFHVNTLGALATLLPAAERMAARRRGTLAAITSLAGGRGLPGHAAYSASKAAVSKYLESIREELRPLGVRVVDVRPGFVDTPLTRGAPFAMPFRMQPEAAADVIATGLERGSAVVAFPWQLSSAMQLAERMPDSLWRLVARGLPR
jgi:short-subunit dehydrogenase